MKFSSNLLVRSLFAAGMSFAAALPLAADPIATVLAIDGAASGPSGPIAVGDRIEDGLIIRTSNSTKIELRFDDDTLMAIGPNAEIEITSVLMNSGGQANRFALNAVTGSFRFLSGDSQREVYEIATPTSTIGIRGTEFDVSVSDQVTNVILYRGALELCLIETGKCWSFRGSCYVAQADASRNSVRGLLPREIRAILGDFAYAEDQRKLSEALQADISFCDKHFPERNRDAPAPVFEEIIEEINEQPIQEPVDEFEDEIIEEIVDEPFEGIDGPLLDEGDVVTDGET